MSKVLCSKERRAMKYYSCMMKTTMITKLKQKQEPIHTTPSPRRENAPFVKDVQVESKEL